MASQAFYTDVNLNGNSLQSARFENLANAPTSPLPGQQYYNTATNKFMGWNGTIWVDLSQVVSSATAVKGEIANANTSPAFPASPASGDTYFITTAAGTVGGLVVEIGDMLMYGVNGWFVLQANLQAATAAIAGYIMLASQAEVNALSNGTKAITPNTLGVFLANFLYSRKVVQSFANVAANTATAVTHSLGLLGSSHVHVQCYMGGQQIGLAVAVTSVNALTITSNQALTNVDVVCIG